MFLRKPTDLILYKSYYILQMYTNCLAIIKTSQLFKATFWFEKDDLNLRPTSIFLILIHGKKLSDIWNAELEIEKNQKKS
jgi:hypothetical protein